MESHNPRKAFTLIELLVAIGIITVLMAILVPSLGKVREQTREKICGTNIRQQVLGLTTWADDHDGKMPTRLGYWFQDIDHSSVNSLLAMGMTPDMFYCPSNRTHQRSDIRDLLWIFHPHNLDDWDGLRFVNNLEYGISVCGYGFILSEDLNDHINQYPTDVITPEAITNNRMKMPSARALVVDLIMSQDSKKSEIGQDFRHITLGKLWKSYGIWDRTNHLNRDDLPTGGNIGFLDGHVEWKKWSLPDYPPKQFDGSPLPRLEGSMPTPPITEKPQGCPHYYW